MRTIHHNGFTLVELLVCIAILGIIVTAVIPLLSTSFAANGRGISRAGLYREGMLAMERMTQGVRRSTYLEIPNAHKPQRDLLAFSGFVNDDNDYYFNDPLFPRIDEDPGDDMNADGGPGIKNYDDDGNGSVDEWGITDDDEDGFLYLSDSSNRGITKIPLTELTTMATGILMKILARMPITTANPASQEWMTMETALWMMGPARRMTMRMGPKMRTPSMK